MSEIDDKLKKLKISMRDTFDNNFDDINIVDKGEYKKNNEE